MIEETFVPPNIYNSSEADPKEILRLLHVFSLPKDSANRNIHFEYGTAGFRCSHELLSPVMVRIAILAGLRSSSLDGESVGIMITASHNPVVDNGVKLSDSNGGMLPVTWEDKATLFANSNHPLEDNQVNIPTTPMVVHIGRDTRPHSLPLSRIAIRALIAMGAKVIEHGCVTTPQLHYYTLRSNPHHMPNALLCGSNGTSFEKEYMESVVGSYVSLLSTCTRDRHCDRKPLRRLMVDCACGVGGLKVNMLIAVLGTYGQEGGILLHGATLVTLVPINLPVHGALNHHCGAEFVQKHQQFPKIHGTECPEIDLPMTYAASLDGDADRIVFHCRDSHGRLILLDGDKIAVLVSSFVQEEIRQLSTKVPEAKDLRCGIVQTAYANGSSTRYLKDIVKTDIVIAKTGVKHVHTAAHKYFDVGIYFEANGHGTVLFGKRFYQILSKAENSLLSTSRHHRATIAWQRLRQLPRLINQAVGDALSDLFLVDAILYLKGWDLESWSKLYDDMPSRQCKVRVKDRSVILTNEDETKATSPSSLQQALDAAMDAIARTPSKFSKPRAFVRPSGTEDAVRVYSEAETQNDADLLATEAAVLVYKLCGGEGDIPSFPTGGKL